MKTGITVLPNYKINSDVWFPLEIFLSNWLASMCKDEFTIVKETRPAELLPTYSIIFELPEDASFVKLSDLPADLSKYIRFN
jgi:hypothetical protein